MGTFRVAVVGAGHIAQQYHLPSLRRLAADDPTIELAALCDVDADRAREMAARYGFRQHLSDYRALLDRAAPDAVWSLVPIPVTRQVAGHFLAQRVPVLMEKPPGQNAQETRELLEIATEHGTPHQVAFNRRHAPLLLRMKSLLAEAGEISALSCQFYRVRRDEPHFTYGTGLHGLDALRFLGDSEVREVVTRPGPRGSAQITLWYESGACGTMEMLPQVGIQSERYTAHAAERTVMVDGVVGWLTLYPGFLHCYDAGQRTLVVDNEGTPDPPEVVSGFYGESAHFIAALRAGQTPAPSLATALRSVHIAEAADRGESVCFGS